MLKKINKINNPYFPAIFAIFLLLVLGSIIVKGFLSVNNLSSIFMITSILTIAAIAQAFVIISGDMGLDLSIGAIMSMTALFGPMVAIANNNILTLLVSIIVTVSIGAVVGLINGIGVQYFKIVPLVMTLIMSGVINGFTIFITKGQPSVKVNDILQSVSYKIIGPIRLLSFIVILILIVSQYFLSNSRYGKSLLLVGNNYNAAKLCGVKSRRTVVIAYMIGGGFAGLAGLMLVGYAGTAQMNMANSYTMLSVAAVVIGGIKLTGGSGNLFGCLLGSLVLVLITTLLQALNMAAGLRSLIQGIILICVLMINSRAPKLRQ